MNDKETVVIDANSKVVEIIYKEILDDGKEVTAVISQTYYRPKRREMWHFEMPKRRVKLSTRMLSFVE